MWRRLSRHMRASNAPTVRHRRTAAVSERHFDLKTRRFTLNLTDTPLGAKPAECCHFVRCARGPRRAVDVITRNVGRRSQHRDGLGHSPQGRDSVTVKHVLALTVGGHNVAAQTKQSAQSGHSQEPATQGLVAPDAIALRAYELFKNADARQDASSMTGYALNGRCRKPGNRTKRR